MTKPNLADRQNINETKAHLQPYPAYREFEIQWLDTIPKHWTSKRAKYLFKKMERDVRDKDDIITAFRDGVVTLRKNRRTEG